MGHWRCRWHRGVNRSTPAQCGGTGGRSGIGRAIAQRLQDEGAHVFTAQRGEGSEFHGIVADFTLTDSPAQMVSKVTDLAGRLDVLVNNAGRMQEASVGG